ncbi:PA2169 family four-helix-bundle protein [Emticicia sp. CRIBPO]|uniref:ferritin-like domain-containing protein n=1 Tax=Emticicia sp. CRIBPO TaxID=2683258 RepID=UPI001412888B|nr:PA2169 family four-helix-bundle protein [Emticicia sp. CRIBPO]NBA89069.1 PA2169 family four-helix-bundle protein [Emticicia sp. CRIBPO]
METTVRIFGDLLRINNDRNNAYKKAVEAISDIHLKSMFQSFLDETEAHIREISKVIVKHGGEPTNNGTAAGAFHQAWINLKHAIGKGNKKNIIDSCKASDKSTLSEYNHAIELFENKGLKAPALICKAHYCRIEDDIKMLDTLTISSDNPNTAENETLDLQKIIECHDKNINVDEIIAKM